MNKAYYIGQRIRKSGQGSFIQTISSLTVFTVAVGVAVMIITYAILGGFKQTIKDKLFSFDSHIQLKKFELTDAFITSPIVKDSVFYDELKNHPDISSVNTYGLSAGILQKNEEVGGIVFKGVNKDFNFDIFGRNLILGNELDFSNKMQVLLSKRIANKFDLELGDKFTVFFFSGNRPKPRKFTVQGIFETGLEEIDDHFLLGDIKMLRNVSKWNDNEIGGYEIFLDDPFSALNVVDEIEFSSTNFFDTEAVLITDKYQYLFQWLEMIDQNAIVMVLIIFVIVFFNLLSTMYILVIDRTSTIGVLKAMGGTNGFLAKVFWYSSIQLVIKGVLWGNVIAIAFCLVQLNFKFIPLDPENYYMDAVPILWEWSNWALINFCTLFIVGIIVMIPIATTIKMKPVKAIKFS
jgi:lipoprotein-releasing system permease protein